MTSNQFFSNLQRFRSLVSLGILGFATLSTTPLLVAQESLSNTVAVVFNRSSAQSKEVANYYAKQRQIPENNVFGLPMPKSEEITRDQYSAQLEKPILESLHQRGLLTIERDPNATDPQGSFRIRATIRYVVLCYHVPIRVAEDAEAVDSADYIEKLQAPIRRNEASVDSELAHAILRKLGSPRTGPQANPGFDAANRAQMGPQQGFLMVTRLDGPTMNDAKRLVDDAISAEKEGLWGRAFFDIRNIQSGEYKPGDDWIRNASALVKEFGFPTQEDKNAATIPADYPLADLAIYAGWYDGSVSGPFANPEFQFQPGAIAYHLHSFSATVLRNDSQRWVGPLIDRGVAATLGCVAEPYLAYTPNVGVFFDRLLHGFTFAEAAYASQNALSWQTTFIGDPLYRPFPVSAADRDPSIAATDPNKPWSVAMALRSRKEAGESKTQLIADAEAALKSTPSIASHPAIHEFLAEVYFETGQHAQSIAAYKKALESTKNSATQQQIRYRLANVQALFGDPNQALNLYTDILANGAHDKRDILQRMINVAQNSGQSVRAENLKTKLQELE